jgi:hypothetical protein
VRVPVLVGRGGKRRIEGTVQPEPEGAKAEPRTTVLIEGPDLPQNSEAYTLLVADTPKALQVPRAAVLPPAQGLGPYVLVLLDGRVRHVAVAVLDGTEDTVWVAPDMPPGGAAVPVVVGATKTTLAKLRDGAAAQGL